MKTPLVSTAATLAAALVLLVPGAAHAQAGKAAVLATKYTCADGGYSGSTDVGVRTVLPTKVKRHVVVSAHQAVIAVVIPEALADALRTYEVSSLSGTITKASLHVGTKAVGLTTLTIADTPVPDSGPMTLVASGNATPFTIGKPGTYVVKIPDSFAVHLVGTLSGGSQVKTDLGCARTAGAASKIASLTVTT